MSAQQRRRGAAPEKPPAPSAPAPTGQRRQHRQQKMGRVMSDKMQKTIVVAVESLKRHPVYKRTYKQTRRFKVHDEHNSARIGDLVRIEETRPLSKEKRWRLVEIITRAAQTMAVAEVEAALEGPEADAEADTDSVSVDEEAEEEE